MYLNKAFCNFLCLDFSSVGRDVQVCHSGGAALPRHAGHGTSRPSQHSTRRRSECNMSPPDERMRDAVTREGSLKISQDNPTITMQAEAVFEDAMNSNFVHGSAPVDPSWLKTLT